MIKRDHIQVKKILTLCGKGEWSIIAQSPNSIAFIDKYNVHDMISLKWV